MSKAIRKARNAFQIGAQLYREIALSAFSLLDTDQRGGRAS
jgi:hypothetical protein